MPAKVMTEADKQLVRDWCAKNGFTALETNPGSVGVICDWGDRRLLFSVTCNAVLPSFFSWTPLAHEVGQPKRLCLLADGRTANDFIHWLDYSKAAADSGMNHLGIPYNKETLWRVAQRQ